MIVFGNLQSYLLYIFVFFITIIFYLAYIRCENVYLKKILYILIFIPTSILLMYHKNGVDARNYEYIIMNAGSKSLSQLFSIEHFSKDIGFLLICNIFYKIGDIKLVYFICSIIILLPIVESSKIIKCKYSIVVYMFIFLFAYYVNGINILRQSLALSISMLATINYLYGSKKFFYLLWFVSISIHLSSIIIILVPVIAYIGNKKISVLKKIIFAFFLLPILIFFVMKIGVDRYSDYLSDNALGKNRDIIVFFIKFSILFFFRKRLLRLNLNNKYLLNLMLIAIFLSFFGLINVYAKRISLYFTIYEVILFAQYPYLFKEKDRIIISILICFMYLMLFTLITLVLKQAGVIPYIFSN